MGLGQFVSPMVAHSQFLIKSEDYRMAWRRTPGPLVKYVRYYLFCDILNVILQICWKQIILLLIQNQ